MFAPRIRIHRRLPIIRSLSLELDPSVWPRRSTSDDKACRSWCWTTTTASAPGAGPSASLNARSKSATDWALQDPCCAKESNGVCGKVFRDDRLVYEFNLLPEAGHKFPAFINLQQPYFEKFLHDAILTARAGGAPIEIRGANRVDAVMQDGDGATLCATTPEGLYRMRADWIIAADGVHSPVREMMGLGFEGRVFEDNFLIADVQMEANFPTERWFWFEPHFKSGDFRAIA